MKFMYFKSKDILIDLVVARGLSKFYCVILGQL